MANCLTHARRYFVDVAPSFPEECRFVIDTLAKVYHNDQIARDENMSPEERLAFHQAESKPLMDKLYCWLNKQLDEKLVEPNSGLGKAIQYMLNHWKALTRFLEVPGAPLDNNICYAASGITDIMPTPGLCRIANFIRFNWSKLRWTPYSHGSFNRHNQRLSRNVSKGSSGRYRSGMEPLAVVWARACSLIPISACK